MHTCLPGNVCIGLSQGRYDKAEPVLDKVLGISRHLGLGDEHWGTIGVKNILAKLYVAQGRYGEAEQLYVKILEIARRIQGSEHGYTLTVMNGLGVLYTVQDRYDQAGPLLTEALETGAVCLAKTTP